jgi:PAS domain S-box-containing protein
MAQKRFRDQFDAQVGPDGDQVYTLKGAERPYRLLIEAMNEGAATVLPDGTILYCNKRFADMAGRPLDKIISSSLLDWVAADQRQSLHTLLKNVPARGCIAEFDLGCGNPEESMPVQFSLSLLDVDTVPAIAVVATDLTERKRHEQLLLHENEELERRVDERTQELKAANHKLRVAEAKIRRKAADLETEVSLRTKELRSTVASLEQFCYTIAHDLRAPLRSMHGFSNALLNDCRVDETAHGYAKRIAAAAARMDLLIRDLLTYGHLNSADLETTSVNTGALLEEVAHSWEQQNARIEIQQPMPRVQANSIGLKQVFENLIGNATKFVAPGVVPKVRIYAEERDSRVRINIKDNGIGIEEKYHQRIFRVFERLLPIQYPGTGIGLAIVQKGMDRMGGRVGVESEPGQGSCFWIELPKG